MHGDAIASAIEGEKMKTIRRFGIAAAAAIMMAASVAFFAACGATVTLTETYSCSVDGSSQVLQLYSDNSYMLTTVIPGAATITAFGTYEAGETDTDLGTVSITLGESTRAVFAYNNDTQYPAIDPDLAAAFGQETKNQTFSTVGISFEMLVDGPFVGDTDDITDETDRATALEFCGIESTTVTADIDTHVIDTGSGDTQSLIGGYSSAVLFGTAG